MSKKGLYIKSLLNIFDPLFKYTARAVGQGCKGAKSLDNFKHANEIAKAFHKNSKRIAEELRG